MKTIKTLVIAALFCTAAFHSNAQKISEKDSQDIQKTYNAFMHAFETMDAQAMTNLFTEDAVHITPMGQIVRGRTAMLENFKNLFSYFKTLPKPDKMERNDTDWSTQYLTKDLILVCYTAEETTTYSDKKQSQKFSYAIILKKSGSNWLAQQVAITPVTQMPK